MLLIDDTCDDRAAPGGRGLGSWGGGEISVRKRDRRRCVLKRAEARPPRECPEAASDGLEATLSEESLRPETRAAREAWSWPRSRAPWLLPLRSCAIGPSLRTSSMTVSVRLLEKAETYDLLNDGTKLLYKAITHACLDRITGSPAAEPGVRVRRGRRAGHRRWLTAG